MEDSARLKYNEYMRKYRQANKEKINAQEKKRRLADPERFKTYRDNYWKRKAEKINKN